MFSKIRWSILSAVFAVAMALPQVARAIEFDHFAWGFDNQVVEGEFNIVSMLVRNPDLEPVDVTLKLERIARGRGRLGAVHEKEVFLSPGASVWVQFTPLVVNNGGDDWVVSWGEGKDDQVILPEARVGAPATVLMTDPQAILRQRFPLPTFADDLFPAAVTSTDTLRQLIFDHVPRWDAARKTAFLDWLHRGGTVYLLPDDAERKLQFEGPLALLNQPDTSFPVGAGKVVRLDVPARDVTLDMTYELFDRQRPTDDPSKKSEKFQYQDQYLHSASIAMWGRHDQQFGQLSRILKVDRNWVLIYLMALAYLATVYPGSFLFANRIDDYRLSIGFYLGATLLFSLVFYVVGSRSSDELTRTHSHLLAKSLGDGWFDVTEWTRFAAVEGDDYVIRHNGEGHQYSTAQEFERVNGSVRSGNEASFTVDMPPSSMRNFVHRSRLRLRPRQPTLAGHVLDERGIERITFKLGAGFPDCEKIILQYRDQLYELRRYGNEIDIKHRLGNIENVYTRLAYLPSSLGAPVLPQVQSADEKEFDVRPLLSLISTSLDIKDDDDLKQRRLQGGFVTLYLYAPLPDEARTINERLEARDGHILYQFQFPLAGSAGPSPAVSASAAR